MIVGTPDQAAVRVLGNVPSLNQKANGYQYNFFSDDGIWVGGVGTWLYADSFEGIKRPKETP